MSQYARVVIHNSDGKPRVSPSLKDEDVLLRYLDAAKFFDFIRNHTLFFSRGDQFEDKFEGSFTKSLKDGIERAYREHHIDYTYQDLGIVCVNVSLSTAGVRELMKAGQCGTAMEDH